jgi:hypothetical protein
VRQDYQERYDDDVIRAILQKTLDTKIRDTVSLYVDEAVRANQDFLVSLLLKKLERPT